MIIDIIQMSDDGVLYQMSSVRTSKNESDFHYIFEDEVDRIIRRGCERQRKVKNGSKSDEVTIY